MLPMVHPAHLDLPETPVTMAVPANLVTMVLLDSVVPQLPLPTGASTATPDHLVHPVMLVLPDKTETLVAPASLAVPADVAHPAHLVLLANLVLLVNLATLVPMVNPVN